MRWPMPARFSPAAVVDIATLTGAQSIALGPQAAAVFCNDEKLAGRAAGRGRRSRTIGCGGCRCTTSMLMRSKAK